MKTILTLTVNPAIDASCSVDVVFPEHKLRCGKVTYEPGGGGINVSRAIHRLGGGAATWYLAGGPAGQIFSVLLEREGLQGVLVPISGWTRENLNVAERTTSQQYRFVMPGPEISPREWQDCLERLVALEPAPDFAVVSGSVAPGLTSDAYAEFARRMRERGSRVVVDSSGVALVQAIRSRQVYLAKPSLRELRELVGRELGDPSAQDEAALEIVRRGDVEVLVVSLGAAGALLASADACVRLASPTVQVKSKVGAGDSMVAGIVLSLARGGSLFEAVRFGVAAGAAATMNPGTQLCQREDVERLYGTMSTIAHLKSSL
jgi:6-phosphofructokinase 2